MSTEQGSYVRIVHGPIVVYVHMPQPFTPEQFAALEPLAEAVVRAAAAFEEAS